jgi:hypothetical protein
MVFEDYTTYKYIRLSTDEFRFTEVTCGGPAHKDLVKEGEKAISAGIISILPDHFRFFDHGSISLGLNVSLPTDASILEQFIGKPTKGGIE